MVAAWSGDRDCFRATIFFAESTLQINAGVSQNYCMARAEMIAQHPNQESKFITRWVQSSRRARRIPPRRSAALRLGANTLQCVMVRGNCLKIYLEMIPDSHGVALGSARGTLPLGSLPKNVVLALILFLQAILPHPWISSTGRSPRLNQPRGDRLTQVPVMQVTVNPEARS